MSTIDELLLGVVDAMSEIPPEDAPQSQKKAYSEGLSAKIANAFAEYLRQCGLDEARPAPPGVLGGSGAERRMSGGIGAKKVDVTWATPESGLILAISIKTINWRDKRTKNFQKNLANRRGDMLFEAVTLHRRFPYAVLCGVLFLDVGAERDHTEKRESTFANAHRRLELLTNRVEPADRDEQFERLYIALFDEDNVERPFRLYSVGDPQHEVPPCELFTNLLRLAAKRNPDLYAFERGRLKAQH